jgi:hypothetical protein
VHVLESVDPGLASGSVYEHQAVGVASGRDTVSVADVHTHDIEGMLGAFEAGPVAAALNVDDTTDRQNGISNIGDVQPCS